MNLRIAEHHWAAIQAVAHPSFSKWATQRNEAACIVLVSLSHSSSPAALLVNDVLEPGPGDLMDQGEESITLSSRFLRRALLAVRERQLAGFLTVHTHPFASDGVRFSHFDDNNDAELMANLSDLQPGGVFGSVVLGQGAACARIWSGAKPQYLNLLTVVGEGVSRLSLGGEVSDQASSEPSAIFDRSLAVTGAGALAELQRTRIGIVGVSGTGSLVAELLMRAGVGELALFDFDCADQSNLGRVLHLRTTDAELGTNKAIRIAEVIAGSGLPTQVTAVPAGDIRDDATAAELAACDLIVGCVDRDWPRLVLSEIAYQYLIPVIDIGVEIGIADAGVQSLDARVSILGPGRPCLVCTGIVSQEQLRLESYSVDERRRVTAQGYCADTELAAPAVMDLNMRPAALAGLVIRHLFQPLLGIPLPHAILESVTNFSIRPRMFSSRPGCAICAAPERLGAGATFRLSTLRDAVGTAG